VFLATFIRSAFGFGEALVAVPLLALLMPVGVAAPVAVLVSITVALVAVAQDWRHVHLRSAGVVVASSCLGILVGLWRCRSDEGQVVKCLFAVVISTFSLFFRVNKSRLTLATQRLPALFGFVAGILGGAYGMNGPPLVAYGTLRRWSPQRFRA